MPRRRRHPEPQMLFPAPDEVGQCNHWCAGLHKVERAVAGQPFAQFFRITDFMMMGMVRSPEHPDVYLHKHYFTRMYLNVDVDGHAYRYVASPTDLSDHGTYVAHPNVVMAIDHLELFHMPWLAGSGMEEASMGIPFERRDEHPATIAWWQRWYEHGCPPVSGFIRNQDSA